MQRSTPRRRRQLLATLARASPTWPATPRRPHVSVEVEVDADVCVRVRDDGVGPPAAGTPRGRGLANMASRAARLGGGMTLQPAAGGGTMLEWRVPLRSPEATPGPC